MHQLPWKRAILFVIISVTISLIHLSTLESLWWNCLQVSILYHSTWTMYGHSVETHLYCGCSKAWMSVLLLSKLIQWWYEMTGKFICTWFFILTTPAEYILVWAFPEDSVIWYTQEKLVIEKQGKRNTCVCFDSCIHLKFAFHNYGIGGIVNCPFSKISISPAAWL